MTELAEPEQQAPANILNVAAYKFVVLEDDLEPRRTKLKAFCLELGLRGTILLSREGINMFVAGESAQVYELLSHLRSQAEFSDLEAKESYSVKVPFRRMLVRIKNEIIPCGIESVRPGERTSPKLSAKELKQWFDEGRSFRLLDTRNKYEVDLGTFVGAEHLDLGHFRDFPDAVAQLPEESKDEPIVMFCTGGIRCEKAGPLMEQKGFREVYQLDGGILKYFEECGGEHYDGSCFVFDGRVALDPELKPTGNLLCFACQAVLTAEDVTSGKFMFGEYCPNCFRSPSEQKAESFQHRQAAILEFASSQPGSSPYTNERDIHVPGRFAGKPMIDFLCAWQPRIQREQWLQWLAEKTILCGDAAPAVPEQLVREGQHFVQVMPNTVEPKINPNIELLHEDESIVVVNKPAPLPCHPSGRYNRNSLLHILSQVFPTQEKLRVAHRLDAWTTGVVVLCRKYRPAKYVQAQFAEHRVDKTYVARVAGVPDWQLRTCELPISAEPVDAEGRRAVDHDEGLAAQTDFRLVQSFDDGTSLIEAMPVTGRTHQIRIHLSALGHAILGDRHYGFVQSKDSLATSREPTMMLHAHKLSLLHPDNEEKMTFEARLPEWAKIEQ
ncbi:MAG: RluA family pseudouridine synthase [Planctomycetota bacterium]